MDLTPATSLAADILAGVGVVGALVVGIFAATKTFGFVTAWISKMYQAGRGRTGS